MGKSHALAFLLGTAAALVIDAALQLGLDAVRVSSYGGGSPWWVTANLVGRGRWVAFAALVWWLAPRFGGPAAVNPPDGSAPHTTANAWRQVGIALAVVPLLWLAATWIVTAVRFTLLGSWDTDGRVFVSVDYYGALIGELAPWLMAAAVVMTVSRHRCG